MAESKIWVSHYTLKARAPLSGKARALERPGALIRIEDSEGADGYADLHPWTELGDLPLDQQLRCLVDGNETSLTAQSKALATLDRESRKKGQSAFQGLNIPLSHYLINDLNAVTEETLNRLHHDGFRVLKLKVTSDWRALAERLKGLRSALEKFRIRFDVNGVLTEKELLDFLSQLGPSFETSIEFIEDPLPWSEASWHHLSSSVHSAFALDRVTEAELSVLESAQIKPPIDWIILKPAVQNPERIVKVSEAFGLKLAVTSYLDHPVGQVGAALVAALLKKGERQNSARSLFLGACGLLSHHSLESNEFSETLKSNGPQLLAPQGTGIGFDDILKQRKWTLLR